ncbi:MAG: hypoxanthine phosphoribosyltransferase [Acidobacteria bacterium]|nr:MAG: hypoxanthine phosphoribosyltransferase [Acidobacteriota bacterium]
MPGVTLITKDQIQARLAEMGREITADYAGTNPIVALDFIQVSSYGNEKYSSGVVTILKEPQLDMTNRAVLIVEDIIDSGLSMREVFRYIESRGASIVRTATFLDKPAARRVDFRANYVGFSIDPQFVIGYGLDYAERYRNIPEIQVLSE